jgi:hypothetical protein
MSCSLGIRRSKPEIPAVREKIFSRNLAVRVPLRFEPAAALTYPFAASRVRARARVRYAELENLEGVPNVGDLHITVLFIYLI